MLQDEVPQRHSRFSWSCSSRGFSRTPLREILAAEMDVEMEMAKDIQMEMEMMEIQMPMEMDM